MAILRTAQVTRLTGLSRVTIWRLERRGDFPRRRQLGRNSVGWLDREVQKWIEARPLARSDNDHSVAPDTPAPSIPS